MGKAQLSFGAQLYSGVSNKFITLGTRRSGFRRLKLEIKCGGPHCIVCVDNCFL